MPGLLKIGKSTRSAEVRGSELSSGTGVPTPFIVAYEQAFDDCDKAELKIHAHLELHGFRISQNREFFNIPLADAIHLMMSFSDQQISEINLTSTSSIQSNYEKINSYYYGAETGIPDYKSAIKLAKKLSQIGEIGAFRYIAESILITSNGKKKNPEKLSEEILLILSDGMQKNDPYSAWCLYFLFLTNRFLTHSQSGVSIHTLEINPKNRNRDIYWSKFNQICASHRYPTTIEWELIFTSLVYYAYLKTRDINIIDASEVAKTIARDETFDIFIEHRQKLMIESNKVARTLGRKLYNGNHYSGIVFEMRLEKINEIIDCCLEIRNHKK